MINGIHRCQCLVTQTIIILNRWHFQKVPSISQIVTWFNRSDWNERLKWALSIQNNPEFQMIVNRSIQLSGSWSDRWRPFNCTELVDTGWYVSNEFGNDRFINWKIHVDSRSIIIMDSENSLHENPSPKWIIQSKFTNSTLIVNVVCVFNIGMVVCMYVERI